MKKNEFMIDEERKETDITHIVENYKRPKKTIYFMIVILIVLINIFPLKLKIHSINEDYSLTPLKVNEFDDLLQFEHKLAKYTYLQTKDKGSLVVVADKFLYASEVNDRKSSYIGKYDHNFNRLWFIGGTDGIFVNDYYLYIYNVAELSNGRIVGVGKALHQSDVALSDLALFTISEAGISYKLFSELSIPEYNNTFNTDWIGSDENTYFDLVSSKNSYTIVSKRTSEPVLIMNFNTEGSLNWYKSIPNDPEEAPNQLFYDYQENVYVYKGQNLKKFSNNGELIWEKNYEVTIKTILLNDKNEMMLIGTKYNEPFILKDVKLFILLTDYFEPFNDSVVVGSKYYAGGSSTFVTKLSTETGALNRIEEFYINDCSYYPQSVTKDEFGNVYIYVKKQFSRNDMILKYDQEGKRIGEILLTMDSNTGEPILQIDGTSLKIIDLKEGHYGSLSLDQLNWEHVNHLNYIYFIFYNFMMTVRVWTNRFILMSPFILYPLYRFYEIILTRRTIKRIQRNR